MGGGNRDRERVRASEREREGVREREKIREEKRGMDGGRILWIKLIQRFALLKASYKHGSVDVRVDE